MHYADYKSILSPKLGMNLYRGCTHGCIYCDSRSRCYGMQHDFEDIEVKANAMAILETELKTRKRKGMIGSGAMSDPYLPLETDLQYTRQSLELIYKYGYGVALHTKSATILRDLDLLIKINRQSRVVVQTTLTTFDEELCRILEPNVSPTAQRLEMLNIMRDNEISTVVWLCPILPWINDNSENIQNLVLACSEAGVWGILCFGMGLTLREGNREYFYRMLDLHFPGLKKDYIRSYGNSYNVPSPKSEVLMREFHSLCQAKGICSDVPRIFAFMKHFAEHESQQYDLFDP